MELLRTSLTDNNYKDDRIFLGIPKFNFNKVAKEFELKLKESFPSDCYINFDNNIKTLKVDYQKQELLKRYWNTFKNKEVTFGYYDGEINLIQINNNYIFNRKKLEKVANHELIHMASAKNKFQVGFVQKLPLSTNNSAVFGKMFNEGYTEYLNQKYFCGVIPGSCYTSYYHEMMIAAGVKRIIGEDLMNKLYFNADLIGLIKELSKYSDIDSILEVFVRTDLAVTKKSVDLKLAEYKKVRSIISDMYLNKLNDEFVFGNISEDEYARNKFLNYDMYNRYARVYSDSTRVIEIGPKYIIHDGYKKDVVRKNLSSYKFKVDKAYFTNFLEKDINDVLKIKKAM